MTAAVSTYVTTFEMRQQATSRVEADRWISYMLAKFLVLGLSVCEIETVEDSGKVVKLPRRRR